MNEVKPVTLTEKEPRPVWHTPQIDEVSLQKTLELTGSVTDGLDGSYF